jgi:hypothetical protein
MKAAFGICCPTLRISSTVSVMKFYTHTYVYHTLWMLMEVTPAAT